MGLQKNLIKPTFLYFEALMEVLAIYIELQKHKYSLHRRKNVVLKSIWDVSIPKNNTKIR